jgi:signal transduction histidine kinase/ligand-binding sensor domain-containing protein/CheY-like chemotaxis protein/AraC-like DNA-binding protein
MKSINLFFFLLVLGSHSIAQMQNIRFEKLTVDDGLSHNAVPVLIQDNKGFMWFGTTDGLCRYDGYNFRVYKNIPGDSTSLSGNQVRGLYQDRSGHIWVGTEWNGLCRFNPQNDNFTRYNTNNGLSNNNVVHVIFESVRGSETILWIGTGVGLNRYIPEYNNFKHYFPEGIDGKYYRNKNFIASVVQDSSGKVWVATWLEGLFYFDLKTDSLVRYEPNPQYAHIFKNKLIKKLYASREENKNFLWVATRNYGLYKIDLQNGAVINYQFSNEIEIRDIYAEKENSQLILWLATDKGIYRLDTKSDNYINYSSNPKDLKSLSSNLVLTLLKDNSGILWAGTIYGVNRLNPQMNNFSTFEHDPATENSLINNNVRSIYQTQSRGRNTLWIGTESGLNKYDRQSKTFIHFRHKPHEINSLSSNIVNYIHLSRKNSNYLWLATENGLNRLDLKSANIKRFIIETEETDMANRMYVICEDDKGMLWIGTHTSLYSFDPFREKFRREIDDLQIKTMILYASEDIYYAFAGFKKFNIHTRQSKSYNHNSDQPNSISNKRISALYEDKNNNIWIATLAGLDRFDPKTETFTHYIGKPELQSIIGILEDDFENLWLATDQNILKFNPARNTLKKYDKGDGLLANQFSPKALFKNTEGEMFFGGYGFNIFHPDKLVQNRYIPPVVLTDFKIFNQSVRPGKKNILNNLIFNSKELELSHDQSVFSFEFSGLDYHKPKDNLYAYRLEGFDRQWVNTDASRRYATYTNLDPGTYTFRVKASNNDDLWNEKGTALKILIHPPWYKTNLAYILYILIIGNLIYWIRRYEINRLALRNESKHLKEVDRLKSRFFANISHEFRTPITLILGPVQKLLENDTDAKNKKIFSMIQRNALRLQKLINQLLDLSRIESGKLQLKTREFDIIDLTKSITEMFSSHAERRNMKLVFASDISKLNVFLDADKYEKIITNLLSNAFKFSEDNTEIRVTIRHLDNWHPKHKQGTCYIEVVDNGIGIRREHIARLFDRFYQVDSSVSRAYEGSGIGLSLVRELVELHHGMITVDSQPGQGSTFSVYLPLANSHLNKDEIVNLPDGEINVIIPDLIFDNVQLGENGEHNEINLPLLLIVEDNTDVQQYLADYLETEYTLIFASDGQQGYNEAIRHIPDLIISDAMMPVMDGFEMCGKIKGDQITSHIPVILLTARAGQENKIQGLQTGADDYLTKPFNINELRVRIDNLVEQRKKLQEKFLKLNPFNPLLLNINENDRSFLGKAVQMITDNIRNNTFNTKQFASLMALDRTQLYRKIKSLTGKSVSEFIHHIRLIIATDLLKRKQGNVSEVAYDVGFSSPSYFAKKFKIHFGVSPSEYAKNPGAIKITKQNY